MSYIFKEGALFLNASATQIDASSAAVAGYSYFVGRPSRVMRLEVVVQTVLNSTTNVGITFWKRPTPGSTSGKVSLGVVTLDKTAAVGQCYYLDISPAQVLPGQEIAFEVTAAASTSGKVIPMVHVAEDSEQPANCSQMVPSL